MYITSHWITSLTYLDESILIFFTFVKLDGDDSFQKYSSSEYSGRCVSNSYKKVPDST